jgi:integrase
MAQRLTDQVVRRLPAPARSNKITYDGELPGFGCRVTAAGARAFVLNYRRKADGVERRKTIGSWPTWSVAAARDEAKRLKRLVDSGGDPVGEHREQRDAPTVGDLIDRFVEEQLPRRRPNTATDYRSMIEVHIRPALGKRKVASLTFEDIDKLHRLLTKTPYRANRVVSLVSTMCSLAIKWKWIATNPCHGVERNHEAKRVRYLTADERTRLVKALTEHDDQDAADVFRLLLLTGARRNEVLAMRWSDIDLGAGVWTKLAGSTKQKKDHHVPLSAPARELLARRLPNEATEWVFPGNGRSGHRAGVKSNWKRILKAAGISNLRIHDLRHSFASHLVSGGASLPLIGSLLGHSNPVTTNRYAHLYDDPQRAAVERVGAAITGTATAEVVDLAKVRS